MIRGPKDPDTLDLIEHLCNLLSLREQEVQRLSVEFQELSLRVEEPAPFQGEPPILKSDQFY